MRAIEQSSRRAECANLLYTWSAHDHEGEAYTKGTYSYEGLVVERYKIQISFMMHICLFWGILKQEWKNFFNI